MFSNAHLWKERHRAMEASPDLSKMTDEDLKALIRALISEEKDISYERRILHGKIAIAKAELINRLKGSDDQSLSVVDVDALSQILAGRLPDLDRLEGADLS
jgi:CO dehydrogenase/acetyl-CoA synthase alpha subunit